MTSIDTFEQAMAFVWERSGYDRGFISNPFAGDDAARLGLVRTERLLAQVGHPERDFPIVHVAGSKGKGSTSSFIDSVLRAAGARSGRFLSPHMHSFLERFVVNDQPIGEAAFTALVADVQAATLVVEKSDAAIGQLTAWELSTAMTLLWFARSDCNIGVVEVGLGGTLDATNVVDPAISVITLLDYEHTAILGSTMSEIASNKAGIIKPGTPVLSAEQPAEGMKVIAERARQLHAPLLIASREWWVSGTADGFTVEGQAWRHTALVSSLKGQHQVDNAGLAVASLHALADSGELRVDITDEAIRTGLAATFIPGRFEVVPHESGVTFVLDGAHSPESMRALAAAVRTHFPGASVTAIVGMLREKNPDAVLPALDTLVDRWLVTTLASPRALDASRLVDSLAARRIEATATASVADAVAHATGRTDVANGLIVVITGSLATVAEARVALGLA